MAPARVIVTGGGGRTGQLVVQKLAARKENYVPVATVRSEQSKASLSQKLGLSSDIFKVVDISKPEAHVQEQLVAAMSGCAALIIATSAVPEMLPKPEGAPPGPPSFKWKEGQAPEQVDWLGQKAQVDAAKLAGVGHVVIISSMGGTNPQHPLNKIADGNILQWKRKAEQYLMKSGLKYTIIHPGGLLDEEGGKRELLLGVDDTLTQGTNRSIPRADVAEVCIQALSVPQYANRAFDLASMPPGQGTVTTDFGALIDGLKGANCDYSINSQW